MIPIPDLELPFEPWPHQMRCYYHLAPFLDSADIPTSKVLAMPTGGGKTKLLVMLAIACRRLGLKLALYAHRKLLTKQAAKELAKCGVTFGVRAAGHRPDLGQDIQVCSFATEGSRTLTENAVWSIHEADVVVIDECHANLHATAQTVMAEHIAGGARLILGLTATPVGCGSLYQSLYVAATNSDLRECGAHCLAETFAPNEPELKNVRRNKTGEFTEGSVTKAIMTPTIVGSVIDHWRRLNVDGRPTILFAPGVDESIWMCEQFKRQGITARHIDADTPDDEREEIAEQSENGTCKVVSNRFVLREGVDWPWLEHCIFATAFGAVSNYLQAGGRLLRSDGGRLQRVVVQDHGGNWHRHGSLNDNREWRLDDDNKTIAARLADRLRELKDVDMPEPICCPKCHRLRRPGKDICPACGHSHKRSVRLIMQTDGELKKKTGRVSKYNPKPTEVQDIWQRAFYANKSRDATFNQVAARFKQICGQHKMAVYEVPFHEDGRPKLRNCPPRGSVYWGLPISEWFNRSKG